MPVLVAYASKHGATRGIAERIAATLTAEGVGALACPVDEAGDLAAYDAFVIGSAAYFGSWLKEAAEFVRNHEVFLAGRLVWLFSSGPLGTSRTDSNGRDLLLASEPTEFAEFRDSIRPREAQVFFGALDPARLTLAERLLRTLPAGRGLLQEGDFRDWEAIEGWARSIAHQLSPVPAA